MNFQGFCGYIALVGMSLYVVSIESQKKQRYEKSGSLTLLEGVARTPSPGCRYVGF